MFIFFNKTVRLCCQIILLREVSVYRNLIFLYKFYSLQDLLLQEGFLFDFLQKFFADVFIKKWLIFSAYLYNERFLTDWLLKAFIQIIIFRGSLYALLDVFSVKTLLYALVFFSFLVLISSLVFMYWTLLLTIVF